MEFNTECYRDFFAIIDDILLIETNSRVIRDLKTRRLDLEEDFEEEVTLHHDTINEIFRCIKWDNVITTYLVESQEHISAFIRRIHQGVRYKTEVLRYLSKNYPLVDNIQFLQSGAKAQNILVYGAVQSGKTNMMLAMMTRAIHLGYKVVLIVRNLTADANQFLTHAKNDGPGSFTKNMHQTLADLSGFDFEHFTFENSKLRPIFKGNVENFTSKDSKYNCKIVLARSDHLEDLNNSLELKKTKVVVFIDEADMIMNANDAGGSTLPQELTRLQKNSSYSVAVSATPWGAIFKKKIFKCDNIFRLEPPEDYVGINTDLIIDDKPVYIPVIDRDDNVVLDNDKKPKVEKKKRMQHIVVTDDSFTLSSNENVLEKDQQLKKHIRMIVETNPIEAVNSVTDEKFIHPVICLIKNSIFISHHKEVQNYILEEYPQQAVAIVFNGDGLILMCKKEISLKGFPSYTRYDRVGNIRRFFFDCDQKCNLGTLLDAMIEHGGVGLFHHIFIISGHLASRGISFVSRSRLWHLTHEYLRVPKSAHVEASEQAVRLCGRYQDNIPLNFHTTWEIYSGITKMAQSNQEIFSEHLGQNKCKLLDWQSNNPLDLGLKTKRKVCKGGNLNFTPEEGMEWIIYQKDINDADHVDIYDKLDNYDGSISEKEIHEKILKLIGHCHKHLSNRKKQVFDDVKLRFYFSEGMYRIHV